MTYAQCNKRDECPIANHCMHSQPHIYGRKCDPHGNDCSVGGYENDAGEWIAETVAGATCETHELAD